MRICLVNAIAPPAAGSRSERTLHLAAALLRRGHEVTLLRARLPPGYPLQDEGLDRRLGTTGVRTITLECGRLPGFRYAGRGPRLGRLVRRALAEAVWPDPWGSFARHAAGWIGEHAKEIDIVVTSGQPHADHLAGYESARVARLPWVADYGDPWTLALRQARWGTSSDSGLERRLLRLAAGVVVTTAPTRDLFTTFHGLDPENVAVIPAGVPRRSLGPPPAAPAPTILQVGTVYGARASAVPFARAVEELRRSRPLRVVWYGELWRGEDEEAVRAVVDDYRIRAQNDVVERAEQEAHVLLLLGNHGGVQIPGKVWRTLGAGREILAIEADEADALRTLPELARHAVFARNDQASIVRALETCIERARASSAGSEQRLALPGWDERAVELERFLEASRARNALSIPAARGLSAWTYAVGGTLAGISLARALLRVARTSG